MQTNAATLSAPALSPRNSACRQGGFTSPSSENCGQLLRQAATGTTLQHKGAQRPAPIPHTLQPAAGHACASPPHRPCRQRRRRVQAACTASSHACTPAYVLQALFIVALRLPSACPARCFRRGKWAMAMRFSGYFSLPTCGVFARGFALGPEAPPPAPAPYPRAAVAEGAFAAPP